MHPRDRRSLRSRRALIASGAATFVSVHLLRYPGEAAQFSWKFGDGPTPTHPVNARLNEAFAKILAETGGAFEIKMFPNSQLGSDDAMISQMRLGAIEMYSGGGDHFDSFISAGSIENAPFAFPNYQAAYKAYDGSLGALVRYQFLAKGMFAFDKVYEGGFREITTGAKPIRTVDDLQGLKLRTTPSQFRLDAFRSLGASPVSIDFAAAYTALQTHLVDGQENPLATVADQKYYEVQKYCSMTNHMWTPFWVVASKAKWDALPTKLQMIARKHINDAAVVERADFAKSDSALRESLTRNGLIFNDVDSAGFKAKLKAAGFYARWRDKWGQAAVGELEKYSGPLV